jgi:hypothetical protein
MNRTGYVIFHEKGKAGLKDADGHVVLPAVYDKILDYDDDGYIRVLKGNIYGTVDLKGKEVIPHSLGLTHLGVFHQHTARAMKNGRWGLVDERGNAVGSFDYALMGAHRKWGYTVTTFDGQQGSVNEKGKFTPSVQSHKPAPAPKPLYPDSYDIPPSFYKGFAVCHKQGKYGILKADGTYLFPMVYSAINWNDFKKEDCWFAEDDRACYLLYPDGTRKMYLKSQAERAPLGIGKIPDKEINNDISEKQLKWVLTEPKDVLSLHPKTFDAKSFFASLKEWTGCYFNPLQFYYRDTDAPIDVDKVYKKGSVIRCGAEMEVTQKLLRPVHKLRFMMASPGLLNVEDFPTRDRKELEASSYEECVIGRNLYFIVMDVYHYAGMVQVLLLQLPYKAIAFAQEYHIKISPKSLSAIGPDDTPLVQYARHDLQIKAAKPVHGHSLSSKWVKKMWQPIGLDENLKPVSTKAEELIFGEDSTRNEQMWVWRANDECGYWNKTSCQKIATNTIKLKYGDVNHFKDDIVFDVADKKSVEEDMKKAEENDWKTLVFNCRNTHCSKAKKTSNVKNVVTVVMKHLLTEQYTGDVIFCCETKDDAEIYRKELENRERKNELAELSPQ